MFPAFQNRQPIEKPDYRKDTLDVVRIWRTIQGEGPFAGRPATFIRLAGCNLQCRFCDTNYTSPRVSWNLGQVLCSIETVHARVEEGLVVITGGEPFRQNIGPLVAELKRIGHTVQIETNGTLYPGDFPWDAATIVCSPKTGLIASELQPHIAALKYVLQEGKIDAFDGLPETTLGQSCRVARPDRELFKGEIYVQPLDEGDLDRNVKNLQAAIGSALQFGHRLCVQVQKIVGLD